MLETFLKVQFVAMLAFFAAMIRAAWHMGTAARLDNQCTRREYELNLLRLEIEMEKAKRLTPEKEALCDTPAS